MVKLIKEKKFYVYVMVLMDIVVNVCEIGEVEIEFEVCYFFKNILGVVLLSK